jgi:hypothetical protein
MSRHSVSRIRVGPGLVSIATLQLVWRLQPQVVPPAIYEICAGFPVSLGLSTGQEPRTTETLAKGALA